MLYKNENDKKLAALEAVKYIKSDMVIGLGTGSTAYYAVEAIGEMVKSGLQIKAVPTSEQTKQLAQSLKIPLIDINLIDTIDITIDGADEFTQNLDLIKGGGGALLREKIVASVSKKNIIITDSSKRVNKLGKFKLPIEVIPFAINQVIGQLKSSGGSGKIRMINDSAYVTDQGNYIVDADFGLIENPKDLAEKLDRITGIVEHGLFINLADIIIMAKDNNTYIFQ
mgnify:CR=1 FL=1